MIFDFVFNLDPNWCNAESKKPIHKCWQILQCERFDTSKSLVSMLSLASSTKKSQPSVVFTWCLFTIKLQRLNVNRFKFRYSKRWFIALLVQAVKKPTLSGVPGAYSQAGALKVSSTQIPSDKHWNRWFSALLIQEPPCFQTLDNLPLTY